MQGHAGGLVSPSGWIYADNRQVVSILTNDFVLEYIWLLLHSQARKDACIRITTESVTIRQHVSKTALLTITYVCQSFADTCLNPAWERDWWEKQYQINMYKSFVVQCWEIGKKEIEKNNIWN